MAMPSPKELKKIAKACREAGIKIYKGEGFELTFTEEAPAPKRAKQAPQAPVHAPSPANEKFTTDSLSEEELLLWSASPGGMPLSFEQEDAT